MTGLATVVVSKKNLKMTKLTQINNGNILEQAKTSNEGEVVSISISTSFSYDRRIHKVPAFLRLQDQSHGQFNYDPVVVSLGPYHHNKEELQLAENFKPKSLELFAARSGHNTDFYYNKVIEVIHDVRRCYVENSTDKYNDDVFAKMMLHDASFIINFISMNFDEDKETKDAFSNHLGVLAVRLVFHDIWLLENQIPFWFLQLLIHLRFGEDLGDKIVYYYLSLSLSGNLKVVKREINIDNEKSLHLLELLRRLHVADFRKEEKTKNRQHDNEEEYDARKYSHSFSSIMDLKAKGIYVKSTGKHSYRDVKFKSWYFYAELQLPFEWISIYTKIVLLNMIAFEMCPNSNTNLAISSYINFFKTLIMSPQDVKELREQKIIYNKLGSDEELLQLYKDMDTYGVDDQYMFYDIRDQIQKHYNSKMKTWFAELFHFYFRSPWSVIALLATTTLLFATIIQSYFTVYPSLNK